MDTSSGRFFIVPGAVDVARLARKTGKVRLKLTSSSEIGDFALLDCFDQSLRRSGRGLLSTGDRLYLLGADGTVIDQSGVWPGKFVTDLPAGPVRVALARFPPLRALLEICRGRAEMRRAVVTEKRREVGRVRFLTLKTGAGEATLVIPDPGQGRAHDLLKAQMIGAETDVSALFSTLAPDLAVYRAKPKIRIRPAEPAIEVANDLIRAHLRVARRNEAGIIADHDTEFLHDYRVALRKVRSVLSQFKGVYADEQTVALKQEFADLMTATGRLRDLDVYLLERPRYFDLLPSSLHGGLEAMFAQFERDRAAEHRKLAKRLHSAGYAASVSDLEALFDSPDRLNPGPRAQLSANDYACRLIWKRYRKVCGIAREIDARTPDEEVHALRLQCKKLRYLMEFFDPLFDTRAFRKGLKPLKKLQENLGLFNDYSVQQEALLAFLGAGKRRGEPDAEIALAVGGLITVLSRRQRAERGRVERSIAKFDSDRTRRVFRTLFHQPFERE
ncbi:MAG: CHAD domain-containing protein [Ruegeria sp.]